MKKVLYPALILLVCALCVFLIIRKYTHPKAQVPFDGDFDLCYEAYLEMEEKYDSLEWKYSDALTDIEDPLITLDRYFNPDESDEKVSFNEAYQCFDQIETVLSQFY